jgi:glycosyltransferase involved in cell wall biosynthesis
MPVLEAMSCGCPVVTSNRSSLKEIADGYAELVDPFDSEQFRQGLVKTLSENRKDILFYKKPLEKYTWDKHVDGLINVINKMLKRSAHRGEG